MARRSQTFLKPFVNELQILEQNGIKWKDSENVQHVSKVYALICSSDSIARPLLRNTKQFNGFYGCDFCYHVGGGPYTNKGPKPHLRTEDKHFDHAMAATPDSPVMGVKGPSPLMKLSKFQMIHGFFPEYQHCVCLGVTRQLAKLWFDSKNHNKEWYLGAKSDRIDKELIAIQPPVEITRVPRSVADKILESVRVEVIPVILCSAFTEWGLTKEVLEPPFSVCVRNAHSFGRKGETL